MIFCPKCGTQNPDGATFCGGCGASINAPAASDSAAAGATQPQASAAAPAPVAAAPVPATAGTPVTAPMPTKPRNSMPIVIGGVVLAIIVVLLLVFLVIPNCAGGGRAGGSVDMKTLVTGKTADAQAVLGKMKAVELDAGSVDVNLYASNDEMKSYVEGLYDDVLNGNIKELDDVINAETAKKLNGQWVLLSTADSSLEDIIDAANSQLKNYDLSHMVVYATVVDDKALTNEKVANMVSGAGVSFEHAAVTDYKVSDVIDFIGNYAMLSASMSGYGAPSSSQLNAAMAQIESMIDEAGIVSVGQGAFYGKEMCAVSVSVQFNDYAVVVLFAFNPKDLDMEALLGPEAVGRMYMK